MVSGWGRGACGPALALLLVGCGEGTTMRAELARMNAENAQLRNELRTSEDARKQLESQRQAMQDALVQCSTRVAAPAASEAPVGEDVLEKAARDERLVQAQEKSAEAQQVAARAAHDRAAIEKARRERELCLARNKELWGDSRSWIDVCPK
jgi:hypothetical protein